ncbi:hypothetical protein AVEN_126319-1 [Araneus ventricosus]|uniref:Uncharacterized protein n=1 Tax=Araneus ventricosus TaxID=182803 RepID=A0A4Y2FGJ0_ARAVE|nr:hypothetical protein AVEN_126319-1 [Araneus ventricosus]
MEFTDAMSYPRPLKAIDKTNGFGRASSEGMDGEGYLSKGYSKNNQTHQRVRRFGTVVLDDGYIISKTRGLLDHHCDFFHGALFRHLSRRPRVSTSILRAASGQGIVLFWPGGKSNLSRMFQRQAAESVDFIRLLSECVSGFAFPFSPDQAAEAFLGRIPGGIKTWPHPAEGLGCGLLPTVLQVTYSENICTKFSSKSSSLSFIVLHVFRTLPTLLRGDWARAYYPSVFQVG